MGSPPPVIMANLGMADTLILMVLALVVLGPRRLPELGRQIGKLMYEFRKASNDFKFQMEEELRQSEEADRRKKEEAERQRALAAAPPAPQLAPPTETPIQSTDPAPPPEPPAEIAADVSDAGVTSSEPALESVIESPLVPLSTELPTFDTASVGSSPENSAPAPAEPVPSPPEPVSFGPTNPRIAPPSIGEKVAAARPGSRSSQQELFGEEAGNTPEDVGPDPKSPEPERSEPAAHHG
jgi:sec-independent protein translocase protein TatB